LSFRIVCALPFVFAASAASAAVQHSRAVPPESPAVHAGTVPASVRTVSAASRNTAVAVLAKDVTRSVTAPAKAARISAALPPASSADDQARAEVTSAQEVPTTQPAIPSSRMQAVEKVASVSPPPSRRDLDGDVRCVAQAVYHEARGESARGQRAVADVVMNRARSGRWGSGACAVVNAPRQFSNRWSWRAPQLGVAAWDQAISIARDAVAGAVGVSSRLMNFRAASMGAGGLGALRIGNHVFW
jgi:N-acetylmuramoyl-L-alanine amidase